MMPLLDEHYHEEERYTIWDFPALDAYADSRVGAGPATALGRLRNEEATHLRHLLRAYRSGIARLEKVVASVAGDLPVVAIGGIGPHNLEDVRAVGVDAWAVIGAIANAPDPLAITQRLCRSVSSSTDR